MRRLWLAVILLASWSADARAQTSTAQLFTVMPIAEKGLIIKRGTTSRTAQDLGLQAPDLPALLRFKVPENSSTSDWEISIAAKHANLVIRSDQARELSVSESAFQLPVQDLSDIIFSFSPAAPNLIYDALIQTTAGQHPQFIITQNGTPGLLYSQHDLTGQPLRLGLSRAIVKLEFDLISGHSQCTGFQIQTGLILTNLHCVDPANRRNQSSTTAVVYGIDDAHPGGQGGLPAIAKIEKKGVYMSGNTRGGLDYALLRVTTFIPAPFRNATVNLARKTSVTPGTMLDLYQIWSGAAGAAAGNAVSVNTQCAAGDVSLVAHPLNDSECPQKNFLHGCDSEGGSSGSPIFVRGTDSITGINWGGVNSLVGNCAVTIDAVIHDLGSVRQ